MVNRTVSVQFTPLEGKVTKLGLDYAIISSESEETRLDLYGKPAVSELTDSTGSRLFHMQGDGLGRTAFFSSEGLDLLTESGVITPNQRLYLIDGTSSANNIFLYSIAKGLYDSFIAPIEDDEKRFLVIKDTIALYNTGEVPSQVDPKEFCETSRAIYSELAQRADVTSIVVKTFGYFIDVLKEMGSVETGFSPELAQHHMVLIKDPK